MVGDLKGLSEAMCAFAEATVDYPRLLATIAERVAGVLRGVCIVRVASEDGETLWTAAGCDAHPGAAASLEELALLTDTHADPRGTSMCGQTATRRSRCDRCFTRAHNGTKRRVPSCTRRHDDLRPLL